MVVENKLGAVFLHKAGLGLHVKPVVEGLQATLEKEHRTQRPVSRIEALVDHMDGLDDAGLSDFLKERLYESGRMLKDESDIPKSYVEKRAHASIDDLAARIRGDQEASLDRWVGLFVSERDEFPSWFSLWVIDSVTRLGYFENGGFNRRTAKTVAPFAELNKTAVAKTRDAVMGLIKSNDYGNFPSFGKAYASQLAELFPSEEQELREIRGEWFYTKAAMLKAWLKV